MGMGSMALRASSKGSFVFIENRDYTSHKFMVVYIPKFTMTNLKVKQITFKSLQVSPYRPDR
jgi:hypothetical protein